MLAAVRTGQDALAAKTLAALRRQGPREVPPVLVEADAARADLAAAACCALGGALVPFGGQTLPATVLVLAALLGATSFHAARVGRG